MGLAATAPLACASDNPELKLSTSLGHKEKKEARAASHNENNAAAPELPFKLHLMLAGQLDLPVPDKLSEPAPDPARNVSYQNTAPRIPPNAPAQPPLVSANAPSPAPPELPTVAAAIMTAFKQISSPAPSRLSAVSATGATPPHIERSAVVPSTGTLSISAGMDYKSGKYGGTSLYRTTSMPVTAKYETQQWAFNLSIPRIQVTESGSYIDNNGATVNYRVTNAGLGDISTMAIYHAYASQDSTAGLDLTGKIKFGTADAQKSLGTGENDYIAQIGGYVLLAGKFSPFGAIGYQKSGQPPGLPSGWEFHNVFHGSLGADYLYDQSTWAEISLYQRQRLSLLFAPQREVSLYFGHSFNKNWNIQAYLLKGLADGSPDFGSGATLSYTLDP